MMDHNDRPPEHVEAIHTGEGIGIDDEEKIIASKISVDKGSATAKASKLAARLLALVVIFLRLPQLQRSPFFLQATLWGDSWSTGWD
jgi:hypothetical protein